MPGCGISCLHPTIAQGWKRRRWGRWSPWPRARVPHPGTAPGARKKGKARPRVWWEEPRPPRPGSRQVPLRRRLWTSCPQLCQPRFRSGRQGLDGGASGGGHRCQPIPGANPSPVPATTEVASAGPSGPRASPWLGTFSGSAVFLPGNLSYFFYFFFLIFHSLLNTVKI